MCLAKSFHILSVATFFVTAGITFSLLYFVLEQALLPAFYIGAVLGSISPAVVVPIVRGLKISEFTKPIVVPGGFLILKIVKYSMIESNQ